MIMVPELLLAQPKGRIWVAGDPCLKNLVISWRNKDNYIVEKREDSPGNSARILRLSSLQNNMPTGGIWKLHYFIAQAPAYSQSETSSHQVDSLWKMDQNNVLKDGDSSWKKLVTSGLKLCLQFFWSCLPAAHFFINYFNWAETFLVFIQTHFPRILFPSVSENRT